METLLITIIVAVVAVIAFSLVIYKVISTKFQASAKNQVDEIVSDAQKKAETIIKEANLQAKDETLKARQEFDRTTRERKQDLQGQEKRLLQKEANLDKKVDILDNKEIELSKREKGILKKEQYLNIQEEKTHDQPRSHLESVLNDKPGLLKSALLLLPDMERITLLLSDFIGLKTPDLVSILEVSTGSVWGLLTSGREHLYRIIDILVYQEST